VKSKSHNFSDSGDGEVASVKQILNSVSDGISSTLRHALPRQCITRILQMKLARQRYSYLLPRFQTIFDVPDRQHMPRRPKQSLLATTMRHSNTMLKPQNYSSIWVGKPTSQKHFTQNGKQTQQRHLRGQKRLNPLRAGPRDSLRQREVDLKRPLEVETGLPRVSNLHLSVSTTSQNVRSSFSSQRTRADKLGRGTISCAQARLPY
jgi:hypothetical protein